MQVSQALTVVLAFAACIYATARPVDVQTELNVARPTEALTAEFALVSFRTYLNLHDLAQPCPACPAS